MIEVSISDFRNNIKHYSKKVLEEDLLVVRNGKPVMKVINPNKNKMLIAKSLYGCIPVFDEKEVMKKKLTEL